MNSYNFLYSQELNGTSKMANQAVFCGTSQHGPQKDNVGIFSSPAFVYQRGPKYTFPEMCFAYAISVPEFMV